MRSRMRRMYSEGLLSRLDEVSEVKTMANECVNQLQFSELNSNEQIRVLNFSILYLHGMGRIPRETVDKILDAVRIEEIIGEFVQLKRSGSSLKGLSPFTQEKTPSFYVSPAKQIFKCFSSGKGGSAISFLMEHEQLTYPEALRWLAKKYNIEVEEEEITSEQREKETERESLFLVNAFALRYFEETLWESPKGQAIGLSYFRERGFTDETIRTFHLGYSPEERDAFYREAVAGGYNEIFIEKTGLCIRRESGGWADRFWGRVMFPIHSLSGRIVGFGGRVLRSDAKTAKYVNSPESEIYSKSKTLYGLFQAKQSIVKEDKCLLVEGYTDVLSFHQSGIKNAVSSSGTALTVEQIRLIKRLTDHVTVLYDGDAAGIRASFRGIDLLLDQGLKVRVLLFPDGEDPDSFARSRSAEELKSYVDAHETDFIRFKAQVLSEDAAGDPIKKAELLKDMVSSVARVQDPILRDVYIRECSRLMDIEERPLFQELQLALQRLAKEKGILLEGRPHPELTVIHSQESLPIQESTPETPMHAAEKDLMGVLLSYGAEAIDWTDAQGVVQTDSLATVVLEDIAADQLVFDHPIFQQMFEEMLTAWDANQQILSALFFTRHHNTEWVGTATDLLTERHTLANWKKREVYVPDRREFLSSFVQEALLRFKALHLERVLKKIQQELEGSTDVSEKERLLKQVMAFQKLRNRIHGQLNRVV